MRILKILGWVVGSVVALLVVGVALIALFFDPNDYRSNIEQLVKDKTGRSFTLSGDLKLSVFPWLAVQVGPAALGNAPGFGEAPMVAIEGARLGVKLWPLLQGRFEIGAVELETPRFVLIKTADGNNWSDLGEDTPAGTPAAEPASGKLQASVASVSISNGSLSYEDRAAATTTNLSNFNFSTGKLEPGQPFDVDSSFTLQRGADLNLDTKFAASITADTDAERYQLSKPEITLLLKGEGYPKDGLPVSINASTILADLVAQTAEVSAMNIEAAGAQLALELKATRIIDAPAITGTIKLAQLSIRELAPKFAIDLPITSDANTLTRFSMDAALNATDNSFELKPLTLKLDDTTLSGSAGIADLDAMAMRFDLLVDQINLDRYLPPEPEGEQPETASAEPTPIPADSIRDLNLRGKLAVNSLTISKIPLTKLSVSMDANNNKLQLNPVMATVYEGNYRGNITLDANGKLPRLALEQHLDGINFAPLFTALFDTKRVAGRGNTSMNLSAVGEDTAAMKQSLSGTLDFNAKDGAIEGLDLWYEIRRARAVLKQQAIPARTGPERTAFTALSGTAQIDKGVVNNKDLVAALQYLKVTGQGSANLASDAVDYRLNATVLKIPAEDKLAEQTQDLSGLTIPVRISGSLTDPIVRPDVEGLLKEKAKQVIDEEKQKLQEKAREKVGEALRGLFGR